MTRRILGEAYRIEQGLLGRLARLAWRFVRTVPFHRIARLRCGVISLFDFFDHQRLALQMNRT